MSRLAKYKSLSDDDLRQLIAKYNIVFEGPSRPQKWPLQYASVFAKIRDIRRIQFDEYGPSENRGFLNVTQLKRAVVHINRVAHRCRKNQSNEWEWRTSIEPLIMSRFNAELMW
jgi:hypothetical protein